jgi:DNA-binding response OmpR family regulator
MENTALDKKSATVLVIEDDRDMNDMVSLILRDAGYEPLSAFDGEEGLEIAGRNNPDAIILDLMLPKMNGVEVCRKLMENESTRSIPVIALTAKNELTSKLSMFVAGAKRYITKPFEQSHLLNEIKRALKQRDISAHFGEDFPDPRG